MSTRKTQLLKRIAGKKGRSTALTEEEKALRAIGDAIENGEIGGGYDVVIESFRNYNGNYYEYNRKLLKGDYQTLYNKLRNGEPIKGLIYECETSVSPGHNGQIRYMNVYTVERIGIDGGDPSGWAIVLHVPGKSWFYNICQDNTLYFGDPD